MFPIWPLIPVFVARVLSVFAGDNAFVQVYERVAFWVAVFCACVFSGQLEDELSRNGWLNVGAVPEVIFDTPAEKRYERALSLLGIDLSVLSQEAGHA